MWQEGMNQGAHKADSSGATGAHKAARGTFRQQCTAAAAASLQDATPRRSSPHEDKAGADSGQGRTPSPHRSGKRGRSPRADYLQVLKGQPCPECGKADYNTRQRELVQVLCDRCDDAWHLKCIRDEEGNGLAEVPSGAFYCRFCVKDEANLAAAAAAAAATPPHGSTSSDSASFESRFQYYCEHQEQLGEDLGAVGAPPTDEAERNPAASAASRRVGKGKGAKAPSHLCCPPSSKPEKALEQRARLAAALGQRGMQYTAGPSEASLATTTTLEQLCSGDTAVMNSLKVCREAAAAAAGGAPTPVLHCHYHLHHRLPSPAPPPLPIHAMLYCRGGRCSSAVPPAAAAERRG